MAPLLKVRNLCVDFVEQRPAQRVLHALDLAVHSGETVSVVGASGCGKSVLLRAIAGLLGSAAQVTGDLRLKGFAGNLIASGRGSMARQRLSGRGVGMVFQHPGDSLNPVLSIGQQLDDVLRAHQQCDRPSRRQLAIGLIDRCGIADPEHCIDLWPHQLSGGMKQRAAIALALAAGPKLLLADEPTTALDTTVQEQILDLLVDLVDHEGLGLLLVTHDRVVADSVGDRSLALEGGRLTTAVPIGSATLPDYRPPALNGIRNRQDPVLLVEDIVRRYTTREASACILDGVSLGLRAGEILALVGESGSGKTSLARIACGLDAPDRGQVMCLPEANERMAHERRGRVQLVFQDPLASFNPRRRIRASIQLALRLRDTAGSHWYQRWRRVAPSRALSHASTAELDALLAAVELTAEQVRRRPRGLSGGQLQRAAIARALARDPAVLICDEAVASLDERRRDQTLRLIAHCARRGLAVLFISHDLAVVSRFAARVAVLYLGRIVEEGPVASVVGEPRHPYTRALVQAIPTPGVAWRRRRRRQRLFGEPASVYAIPDGCRFHPRCPYAISRCREQDPHLLPVNAGEPSWRAACIRLHELEPFDR